MYKDCYNINVNYKLQLVQGYICLKINSEETYLYIGSKMDLESLDKPIIGLTYGSLKMIQNGVNFNQSVSTIANSRNFPESYEWRFAHEVRMFYNVPLDVKIQGPEY
jgi:hypothetical protein